MAPARIILIPEAKLNEEQRRGIDKLLKHCFSDVPEEEIEECFIAESFGRVLAYKNDVLVGHLRLFKRRVEFDGRELILGGIGGTCVLEDVRGKGIATKLIKKGVGVLKVEKCDVACLNADLSKTAYKLYEKLVFLLMKRKISFEDIHGRTRYDCGTMFIPICSKEIYQHIMSSDRTFHYGKGYW
jgi:GNAT superfamily N-acetyltransferase